MTVTIHIADVITAISNLSITGVVICDLNEIPDGVDARQSYLIPSTSEPPYVNNASIERVTFGHSVAGQNMTYTLNYTLLYKPVGTGRGVKDVWPQSLALAVDVIEAIQNTTTLNGAVTWKAQLGSPVIVTDPSQTAWDGWTLSIEVLDFIQ